jgi:hypothetical protein
VGHLNTGFFPGIEIDEEDPGLRTHSAWREQDYLLLLTASGSLVMNLSLELDEE